MRWLARILWLSAWAVWLWLGFGLYHHLPRVIGPAVRQLSTEGGAALGFVGDSDNVAVSLPRSRRTGEMKNVVLEAESGRTGRELTGSHTAEFTRTLQSCLRRGVWLEDTPKSGIGLVLVDLSSAETLQHWVGSVQALSFHPRKPWLAFAGGPAFKSANAVVIVDFKTGERLFTRNLSPSEFIHAPATFIADHDMIVMQIHRIEKGGAHDLDYEVWKISEPPTQIAVVKDLPSSNPGSMSLGGRFLFGSRVVDREGGGKRWVDVYDFVERKFLSSFPEYDPFPNRSSIQRFKPVISKGGRNVLRGTPTALHEIDTGRVLWQGGLDEEVSSASGQDDFVVKENWSAIWRNWFPNLKCTTLAVRSLETGELLHRTMDGAQVCAANSNSARTLTILADGSVHRLPLPRNWLLLIICQVILAAPLVLRWFVVRLRCKRRLVASNAP